MVVHRRLAPVATLLTMLVALSASFLLAGAQRANAQETTPAATLVDSTVCNGSALSRQELIALAATPGASMAMLLGTPVATPTPPAGGMPADAATTTAVTAVMQQIIACTIAGDAPRLLALYSPAYRTFTFGGVGDPAAVDELATPQPFVSSPAPLPVLVTEVHALPEGRVSAIAQVGDVQSQVVFVQAGDNYLLDFSYRLSPPATPIP